MAILCIALGVLWSGCTTQDTEPPGTQAETASTTASPKIGNKVAIPTPTAIAPVGPECPVDDAVCSAAKAFVPTLNDNSSAVSTTAQPVQIICPPSGVSAGLTPLCTDANAGTSRLGYSIGSKMLQFVDQEGLAAAINQWTSPNGQKLTFHIVSVACPRLSETAAMDCSKYFAAGYAAALQTSNASTQQVIMIGFSRSGQTPAPIAFRVQTYDPDALTASWGRPIGGGWGQLDYGVQLTSATSLPGKVWFIPWNPNKTP
jgi:hypothetical protein